MNNFHRSTVVRSLRERKLVSRSETTTMSSESRGMMAPNQSAHGERPWYQAGLRFRCTGCGRCCTGDPGFVYVTREEIAALAARLGCGVAQFEAAFVRAIGRRKSLVELTSGDCVFFDRVTRRCRVYDLRPRQCRTWPFWASNVETPSTWEQTCRACPGSGRGPLVAADQIATLVAVIRV